VRSLLLASGNSIAADGLTRLADSTTAIVLSSGNVGVVDEWGVEVGAHIALTDALSFAASYTWYDFAIRQNPFRDVPASNTPRHKGTVSVSYRGRRGLEAGLEARFVAGYPWSSGVYVGDVPAYQTVNAKASYRFTTGLRI
jgi:outer membrane receptor protein involved in Fe transport